MQRPSFDHLVGAREKRIRHGEAERLRRLQVDNELKLCWRLDGQRIWARTAQDPVDIGRRTPVHVDVVDAISNQSADLGEVAERVYRRRDAAPPAKRSARDC